MKKVDKLKKYLGITRIAIGWIFLWSFLDKTFGLMATDAGSSWLSGASPTAGFLQYATRGPFAALFQAMAGIAIVDWLFMMGLLGIGIALILGVATRVACWSGIAMMALMWLAVLPPEHNPVVDKHIVYILLLLILMTADSGKYIGLGKWWEKQDFIKS